VDRHPVDFIPPEFSVVVYDGDFNRVGGKMLLSTLRATYNRPRTGKSLPTMTIGLKRSWNQVSWRTQADAKENGVQVKPDATKQQFVDAILGESEEDGKTRLMH